LKAEIARDKEARRANKGVLPSVLGVDGYNPSAVQYSVSNPADQASVGTTAPPNAVSSVIAAAPAPAVKSSRASVSEPVSDLQIDSVEESLKKVEGALVTISRYRTGGDGGQALKMLLQIVQNIVLNPNELKYHS
jgi:hypothetical protein